MSDVAAPKEKKAKKPKEEFVSDPGGTLEELIRLSHRFAASLTDAEMFTKRSVSVAEWSLLGAVKETPGGSVGKLGKASGISRQRTRQLLNALEAAKLVEITRSEEDKRGRSVALTTQGEDALAGVKADLAAVAGELMDESAQKVVKRADRLIRKLGQKLMPKVEKAETAGDDSED